MLILLRLQRKATRVHGHLHRGHHLHIGVRKRCLPTSPARQNGIRFHVLEFVLGLQGVAPLPPPT